MKKEEPKKWEEFELKEKMKKVAEVVKRNFESSLHIRYEKE